MSATAQNVPMKLQKTDLYVGIGGGGIDRYPSHLDNQKGHRDRSHNDPMALLRGWSRLAKVFTTRDNEVERGTYRLNDADILR